MTLCSNMWSKDEKQMTANGIVDILRIISGISRNNVYITSSCHYKLLFTWLRLSTLRLFLSFRPRIVKVNGA